jgi:hypothetical protein
MYTISIRALFPSLRSWKYNPDNNAFEVRAFGQLLQCAPPVDPEEEKKRKAS